MDFACQMMDLCRGTGEVEAVLGEENTDVKDPLARLRMAIQYDEKKVGSVDSAKLIKAKRQYLLTWKVSRFCLLALYSSLRVW